MIRKSTMKYPGGDEEESLLKETHHDDEKPTHGETQSTEIIATEEKVTWRSLPQKKQLLLLALCRLSTPLSNTCLLPYLYHLAESILKDPQHPSAQQEISRLTGLLVAGYPLGQMTTSMIWGRLSDEYGRRPVILLGIAISVFANFGFGFSKSFGMLLFWRVLAGMANGILGVMRTMTAEVVQEKKYRTRAFIAMPVVFNSGRVAALAIGGCLADPVRNIAWLFGPRGLFNVGRNEEGVEWAVTYPYALPAIFNGIVLAICLVLAAFGLRETHPTEGNGGGFAESMSDFIRQRVARKSETLYTAIKLEEGEFSLPADSPVDIQASSISTATQPARECCSDSVWTRPLLKTLIAFGLLPLHNATFLHIFPVFLSMPASNESQRTILRFVSGLGHSSPTVGVFLATVGILGIVLQLFIYPHIQSRIGTLGVFRLANAIFPMVYIFAPFLSFLGTRAIAQWPAMIAVLFVQVLARTMAIPSSVLLLTEAAPRRNVLGTVHGAGNTLSSFSSAIGPVVGGFLLAKGIEAGAIGLVWWCWMLVVALVACVWSFLLSNDCGSAAALEPAE